MLVNMQTKNICLNKCQINDEVSSWIEQDIIVPDTKPDAIKIVNVLVTPYVSNYEILQGKIKIIGKLNYFIIYKVNDDKYINRGLFVSYPYTEVINVQNVDNSMDVRIIPKCKNVIFSLPNERKMAIKAEIVFSVKATCKVDINLIKNFDEDSNIECKMCEKNFCNILQNKHSIIASKEEVMLPKDAEDFFEILSVEPKICNTEYKESYNKIMVKGDISLKIVYLCEGEVENVKNMNLDVPFSAMIELENINDKSKFDIKYIIQDFNIKLNPEITTTKTFSIDYQIDTDVTMYEEESVEYVEDFYSKEKELEYDVETVEAVSSNAIESKIIEVKENITNILPQNTRLIDYTLDTSYINANINGATVELDGNAKLNLLLQDIETNELSSKTVDILVNEKYDIDNLIGGFKANIELDLDSINVTQSGNDIEAKMSIDILTNIQNVLDFNIIDKIEDGDLDFSNIDSINVYIVKPGDSLWKIAKKYKTSIDKIVKINDIVDPDKIEVGQKILIIR